MNGVFINPTLTQAINDYLNSKEKENSILYNSFLVVCIRLLIVIYSETDIINPFTMNSVDTLKNNLKKFGYSENNINLFFENLANYDKFQKENSNVAIKKPNPYFEIIQRQIIDMLMVKKVNFYLSEKEINEFYELLYTPTCKDPLRISELYLNLSGNNEAIKNYFEEQMVKNVKLPEEEFKSYLNNRSYEIMGLSMDYVKTLNESELDKLNHQVYDYFKIRENAINKEYLLEKAIEEYDNAQAKLTTGNGYVDILLVMGVITTLIMIGTIIKFLVF